MKLALTVMFASAFTRLVWGAPVVADALWFTAALQVSWAFHNDSSLHRHAARELPAAAVVRA